MERDLPRDAAERMLDGDLTPPPEGAEKLAALLAAASAPGRPDELAGEAAAMAAFRANPPTVRRWSLRRALTVKVAAVVAATVAAGGVAVASGTGLLPNPFQPAPGTSRDPSGSSSPADRSPMPAGSAGAGHTSPAEALHGLCHTYLASPPAERGKALQSPPFADLVREAKGAENVDAYCEQMMRTPASPAPDKSKDGGPNKPSVAPQTPPAQVPEPDPGSRVVPTFPSTPSTPSRGNIH